MELIKVKNMHEAVSRSKDFLPNETSLPIAIGFTGGRFGSLLLEELKKSSIDISNWKIFQTDERILCDEEDIIQTKLISCLKSCKGFSYQNLNLFSYDENFLKKLSEIEKEISYIQKNTLDLCYLSLGEDGHLAGHFQTSQEHGINNLFSITMNAPKKPQKRVSFGVPWLAMSKKLVLISIGTEKRKALKELIDGKGLHSVILENESLTIISDF